MLRKIPTQLRGTDFCTSSACFAPSSVRQPNGPKCSQIVRNATKCQFRFQWGGSRLRKMPTRLHGMTFCTSLARFAPSFIRQPNGPKCTQIVRNEPKRQFRVQWGGSGLRNIPTRLRGTFFCTSSARFAPSSVRQPNGPKCTQIVWNAPKRQFSVL